MKESVGAAGVVIHPTAIVSEGALLGEGTVVGPYAIVGPHVRMGRGNIVGAHAVIDGHTTLGDENQIFSFAAVGGTPQDLKYKGEPTTLVIGSRNLIREYVTLHPGTVTGTSTTIIGDRNLFMANSHVGHDGRIGNGNIFANSAGLAGHVTVGNSVTVGGLSGIHQFVRLGDFSFIGGGAMVVRDVPPQCLVQGDRAHLCGINRIGLRRRGVNAADIRRLGTIYRQVFYGVGRPARERLEERVAAAKISAIDFPIGLHFLAFFEEKNRGVTRPRRGRAEERSDEE